MQKGNKLFKAICCIAILLVAIGVVGFILKLTNGGTDTFKLFYLTNENGDVYASTDNAKVPCEKETIFNVNYTFAESNSYSVQVLPNITDGIDFEYTVDGDKYKFSDLKDLSGVFKLKTFDNYFIIEMPLDMQQAIQSIYSDNVVEVPNGIDIMTKSYFQIIVTTPNGNDKVTLRLFKILPIIDGVEIDPDTILM